MDSLVIQYTLIGVLIFAIVYALFRNLRNAFRRSKKGGGCDTNCGCS
ncbi:FeoB-associated Cys-rich membrane protein [Soonwooa sp.]|nr:FeoB-associated Cys-rich membrane protein [Soonwooa sp.]